MKEEPSQQPTQKVVHSAMEDSFEIVDISRDKAEGRNGRMAEARRVRAEGSMQGPRDHSFYTKGNEGKAEPYTTGKLQEEQPWHRVMMFLCAQGRTNKEIAEKLNKTPVYVGQVRRSTWFREQLEAYIEEEGGQAAAEVLKGELLNSIYVLVDVRDSEKSKQSDKIAASNSIIDRVLGKAPQTVTHVDGGRSNASKRQDELDEEIKRVEDELRAIEGPTCDESPEANPAPSLAEQAGNTHPSSVLDDSLDEDNS